MRPRIMAMITTIGRSRPPSSRKPRLSAGALASRFPERFDRLMALRTFGSHRPERLQLEVSLGAQAARLGSPFAHRDAARNSQITVASRLRQTSPSISAILKALAVRHQRGHQPLAAPVPAQGPRPRHSQAGQAQRYRPSAQRATRKTLSYDTQAETFSQAVATTG